MVALHAVRICEEPTAKYPNGRTGTPAGYQAHRHLRENPCGACKEAHLAKCRRRWEDLTPLQRERRVMANRLERARYRKNSPELARAAKHRFIRANKLIILEAKNVPCADCGVLYPYYVMQFDHVGDDKSFNIGVIGRTCSKTRLLAEIAKCEVVCANCHSERSYQRLMQKMGGDTLNEAI